MILKRKISGVTLIESMLVLVIGAFILMMALQLFQSYRREVEVTQLKANVDAIFQAMQRYFLANCADKDKPFSSEYPDNNGWYSITLDNLITEGYLTTKIPISPLLDYTDPNSPNNESVYVLQYNQVQPLPERTVETVFGTKKVGKIVIWKPQVAVLLKNQDTLEQYKSSLLATCLSGSGPGGTVAPCSQGTTGSFAVFERMPSAGPSVVGYQSTYWPTMPVIAQFKQMYTTWPILVLVEMPALADKQYFVCNG